MDKLQKPPPNDGSLKETTTSVPAAGYSPRSCYLSGGWQQNKYWFRIYVKLQQQQLLSSAILKLIWLTLQNYVYSYRVNMI